MRIPRKLLVFACLAVLRLPAHDPGLSSATLWLQEDRIKATLSFSPVDVETLAPMDMDGDGEASEAEFQDNRAALETLVRQAIQVYADERLLAADDLTIERTEDRKGRNVEVGLRFPVNTAVNHLSFTNGLLPQLSFGHRQYMLLFDTHANLVAEAMLDGENNTFQTVVKDAAGAPAGSFEDFFALGLEHILAGYDHLLFLFGLLVAGVSLASAAKIITSFTVAHSITLALATFEVVQISPAVIEPLIAVSIAYVGVENIVRRNLDRRWLLTFAFGLVHGLGFASVLRDLGVHSMPGGAFVPLLAFNLGVETGQIAIAAAVLPVIWSVTRHKQFARSLRPAASAAVAALGVFWLVQRVFWA